MRFEVAYWIDKRKTFTALWFSRHLPRWLKYWVVIQATAEYTTSRECIDKGTNVPDVTWSDVAKWLEKDS